MVPSIVRSGVAHLCGITKLGYPVVYFSSSYSPQTNEKISFDDVCKILTYYSKVAEDIHGTAKIVLLANFKTLHNDVIPSIIEASKIFHCTCAAVHHMYIFDKTETNQKLSLKKLMKPSKKRRASFSDQLKPLPVTSLESYHDLFQFIDPDQVGVEFQGRLSFNLISWVHVQSMVETLNKIIQPIKEQGPKLLAQLESKRLEKIPDDPDKWLSDISLWYKEQHDSLHIQGALRQCQSVLNVLACPYVDPLLSEMEGQPVFKHAKVFSLSAIQDMSVVNRQILSAWTKLEKFLKKVVTLHNFEKKVEQSEMKMNLLEKKVVRRKVEGSNNTNDKNVDLYKLIICSTAEGHSLLEEVKQLKWSDETNFSQLNYENSISSFSNTSADDEVILSDACREKLAHLLEKCTPRPGFIFGDTILDVDFLYRKCFEFYHHIIASLPSYDELANLEVSFSVFLALDVSQFDFTLTDLICLYEKVNDIENTELRHQTKLLLYRSSVLLKAYTVGNSIREADLKSVMQWKLHYEAHCDLNNKNIVPALG